MAGTGDRAIEIVGVVRVLGERIEPGLRQIVAWREWVYAIPPSADSGDRGSAKWVAVSDDGFCCSTTLPLAISTTTIVGGHHLIFDAGRLNDHQLARLIDRADVARVKVTSPCAGRGFAASTSAFSCSNM